MNARSARRLDSEASEGAGRDVGPPVKRSRRHRRLSFP